MTSKKIPQEIRDYIKAHVNERPRTELAKRLGISYSSVQNLTRKYGGEKLGFGQAEKIDDKRITELYPVMLVKDIAAEFGVSRCSVARKARKMGLKKSPALECRLKEIRRAAIESTKLPENKSKCVDAIRKARRKETWRIKSGMPQKTKWRYNKLPIRTRRAICGLKSRYNYFQVDGSDVLYYDSQTRRCSNEQHFFECYGLKFEKAEDEE